MNAGAYGSETKEVLRWAEVYKPGTIERLSNADLKLYYARSV